jgi:hypothetical protein
VGVLLGDTRQEMLLSKENVVTKRARAAISRVKGKPKPVKV